MASEEFKRRLTAILSADVEGYSRLMRENEEATVRTLTTYRTAMTHLINQYRGRVVDSPGDNILAEFTSVVDAVNCGVEIQRELAERNAELPENRRMRFRIGINLGDVLEEGERIYGDGVNIAARMESLAEAGEICISGTVYDAIENKIGLEYEYLGEHEVKNIDKPIRAYRVLSYPGAAAHRVVKARKAVGKTWRNVVVAILAVIFVGAAVAVWHFYFRSPPIERASVEKMAYPLPDKPSIAVLPFVNMSEDPKQEYFSDGITESIITTLSKIRDLFVIARNSSFTYKGKPVKVQKVAEDLGVRYVLEGSVQRTVDRVRITAQLIDATRGHHIWSERYDRDLKDIFTIQDDITMEILKAMHVELLSGEQARLWVKYGTANLKAYEKFLQARFHFYRGTKEDNARARQLYEEAIALDTGYVGAYASLGWTHFFDARFGWSDSRVNSVKIAFKYAQKAIALDDTLDYCYTLLGAIYFLKGQHEKAISEGERALALNPNGAHVYGSLAGFTGCAGRWEESIEFGKKSIRLDPVPPVYCFHWLGRAYFMTRQYDEAITTWEKALHINPDYLPAHAFLAACYISLGRETESAAAAAEVLRVNPKFCLESYAKTLPYKNKADIECFIAALRKAGLPETPPLPLPDKPSIAVLPFVNMSEDPEQEYFSDGITEEIITALSKTPKLFVIARNSTFTYKGKPVKVQKVGRELGVKYVLEGSVRKAEDKVRITAQLIDAQTGHHLWAERYDRDLKDIFALQDEITKKIITALQVKLTEGEQACLYAKGTDDLVAYLKAMEGRWYCLQSTKDGNRLARKLAEEAIALDPKYAFAYNVLGLTHINDLWLGLSKSPRNSLMQAIKMAKKAIALDDSFANAHGLLGYCLTMARRHDEGIAEGEKAVSLWPSSAGALQVYATILTYAGRREEAIPLFREALRLNPMPPNIFYKHFGMALRDSGQYEEAIALQKKAIEQEPNDIIAYVVLASSYSYAGRDAEARAAAEEILRINPKFSVARIQEVSPHKDRAVAKRLGDALRKAGLK